MVKLKKRIIPQYDQLIPDGKALIEQLESLKENALEFIAQDIIFQKDFHALKITIDYLEEVFKND